MISGTDLAAAAVASSPQVIAPFPGGVARSGSKVGSRYKALKASTADAYCPTLRGRVETRLQADFLLTNQCPIMQGYLKQIFDAFGPERMFWGTDISKMPCSWGQCVTMFTDELDWLIGDDLNLVMGQAICDWWGWKR